MFVTLQCNSQAYTYLFLGQGVAVLLHHSLTQKYNFPLCWSSLRSYHLWKTSGAHIEGPSETLENEQENTALLIFL